MGVARFPAAVSVNDFTHLGASLSLRSCARFGAALSVLDFVNFGASLSVRGDIHVREATYTLTSKVKLTNVVGATTYPYIHYDSGTNQIDFYPDSASTWRPLTLTSSGGTMHGLWTADVDGANMGADFSDRSLKENIHPLFETLRNMQESAAPGPMLAARGGDARPEFDMATLLQRLSPVAYNLKGRAAGQTRFGFIADEIQRVLPQVTRVSENSDKTKGIMYMDFIAVLVNTLQDLFANMRTIGGELETLENRIHLRKQHRRAKAAKARRGAAGPSGRAVI